MSVIESELQATKLEPIADTSVIRIEPSRAWLSINLQELWVYRELVYFLVWRDVKVRYKQTVIGIGWTILQPFMTMVIFTVIFGNFAKVPSDGLPYPVFAYTGLLPWDLFANALNRCTASLVSSANLITKVYFPRLIVPASAVISGVMDFAIAFVFLLGIMLWFHVVPTWDAIALPIFLLLALMTALAVGLWLSALNVRYRDVGHAVPFLIQIWMFLSPVAYPVSLVPERWRLLYSLNPMVGVIEGFRWVLVGKESPDFKLIAASTVAVVILLLAGLIYFKRIERTFADVV
jgi:lipopolysaccharide transport system permease protein